MKRKKFVMITGVVVAVLSLITLSAVIAQKKSGINKQKGIDYKPLMAHKIETISTKDYKLSGPYVYKNLTVVLVHGTDKTNEPAPLILDEAMEQKKAVVHEPSQVNQLFIENLSDKDLFIHSGDIVKGGKQDRVLSMDVIIPAKSGKIPIESFCVESGRWAKRGSEDTSTFASSKHSANTKDLKIAYKSKRNQDEVWENVSKAQDKMSRGVSANSAGGGGNVSVSAAESRSSLLLSLENKDLEKVVEEYKASLSFILSDKTDVIGFAFAINGELNNADIYNSQSLMKKLWPKLLHSAINEAIGEFEKDKTFAQVKLDTFKTFIEEKFDGSPELRDIAPRVTFVKAETSKNMLFETLDKKFNNAWVHKNYVVK